MLFNSGGSQKQIDVDPGAKHNLLRPETVESLFILWRLTHKQRYRDWAWQIFIAFRTHCRVPGGGYSDLRDVTTTSTNFERNWVRLF